MSRPRVLTDAQRKENDRLYRIKYYARNREKLIADAVKATKKRRARIKAGDTAPRVRVRMSEEEQKRRAAEYYLRNREKKLAAAKAKYVPHPRKPPTPEELEAREQRRKHYIKGYNEEHAEENKAYHAKYRREKPEIHAQWCKNNPERVKKYAKNHRTRNGPKLNQKSAENYKKKPDYEKQRRARYYASKRAEILARQAKDRADNPEKHKKRRAEKYAKDPEAARIYNDKRRAQKASATVGDLKAIYQWNKAWRKKPRVKCHYCLDFFPPKKCEQDHVVALSSGGPHCLTNLVIACKKCNRLKHAKSVEVFNACLIQPVLLFE